jgi:hypothetical protein
VKIPDSVVAAYIAVAVERHGAAGADIDDEVQGPDSGELIGRTARGDCWRVKDGWGTYYLVDPPRGDAIYVCSKMEDVMAVDAARDFRSKIDIMRLGMGDVKWDAAVLAALGEKT